MVNKPLFLRGGSFGGGWLNSHEIYGKTSMGMVTGYPGQTRVESPQQGLRFKVF